MVIAIWDVVNMKTIPTNTKKKCFHPKVRYNNGNNVKEMYCPDCHLCMIIDKGTRIGRKWYEIQ